MSLKESPPAAVAAKSHVSRGVGPDEMLARVLHRDGLMLIIDKPAGLSVHRGPKGGPSLEDYLDALRYGLPRRPELAHRLDKAPPGCRGLGRPGKALAHRGLLFKHRKTVKTYWAVVEGAPAADEGVIDLPLGRLDDRIGWWMKPDPNGLPSVTKWKVIGRSSFTSPCRGEVERPKAAREGVAASPHPRRLAADPPPAGGGEARLTWLSLEPLTGRTHQLRVHCAAKGWPIVGDDIYGTAPRFRGPMLHLHAREIVVPISKNKPPVRVVAPVPAHMRERLALCGWTEDSAPQ